MFRARHVHKMHILTFYTRVCNLKHSYSLGTPVAKAFLKREIKKTAKWTVFLESLATRIHVGELLETAVTFICKANTRLINLKWSSLVAPKSNAL